MNRILIIDDDVELCDLLKDYLGPEGFDIETAHSSDAGLNLVFNEEFSLVVLDVMLPGLNGFEVLRRIREGSRIPVIMLTARGDDVDRIVGLEMGADDYLAKPFNPRELVARIRAVQRRTESFSVPSREAESEPVLLHDGDIVLDPSNRRVTVGDVDLQLTSVEFSLLHELLKNKGRVISRDELAEHVLDRKLSVFDRSIDVHVSSLRKKLGTGAQNQERIKSVRGVGYLFTVSTPVTNRS
ncbi:MAG: response regulator transcription factor [Desulfobacteraceae bacterium]